MRDVRTATAVGLLGLLLAGCAGGAPAGGTDAVIDFTAPGVERYRGDVRVAVHPLVVDGDVAELRVELTPLGGDEKRDEGEVTIEDLLDHPPLLRDVGTLTWYEVLGGGWKEPRRTDVREVSTTVGETVLYQAWFAAPPDDATSLDLVVHPSWPSVAGLPVVRP